MLSPEKLKYLRLLHNLTQTDVAKEINATKNYLSMLENNKEPYSQEMHDKIVNAIYKVSEGKKKRKEENIQEIIEDVGAEVKKKMDKK